VAGTTAAGQGELRIEPRINGVAAAEGSQATRAAAATPGYRSYSPQLMQAAEQARDSVFRQILFRIHGGTSEMRVLLDPPELGQMDMTMIMDKAGVLQLSITAERPELALMLNKHMPELRQALAAQGLEIGSADVSAHDDGTSHEPLPWNARPWNTQAGNSPAGRASEDISDPEAWVRHGYIRADGLDFWV